MHNLQSGNNDEITKFHLELVGEEVVLGQDVVKEIRGALLELDLENV